METGLRDRVVVVTGGSSGIGRETALAFAAEGARVAITYRVNHAGAEACATEVEQLGGRALVLPLDLDSADDAIGMVGAIVAEWGGIDVLVNSAGGRDRSGQYGARFEDMAPAEWRGTLSTDLLGPYALAQSVVPAMRGRGWGRIVFVSSGAGEEGWEGSAHYASAKAGLIGLARSLAWELGREGILVNVVAAGLTLTERVKAAAPTHVIEAIAARVPSRRLSSPAELARLIVFLSSEANGNMSGELVHEGSATGRSAHSF